MVQNEVAQSGVGAVLSDGTNGGCKGDCAQFKGIGYRYLDALASVDPTVPSLLPLLADSSEAVWTLARDAQSGLFGVDWTTAPPSGGPFLIEAQSASATALNLAAARAGAYPVMAAATQVLEAEESVLHGLGIEAGHAGFTGFGYVAGWNADGQWVDFHPRVGADGMVNARLRYAAAAGDAVRLMYVNGQNVVDAQSFPATTAWEDYHDVSLSLPLVAGENTVSVIYNGGMGSKGFLNLDHLELDAPAP
jgi:hypothetical protein